MMNELQIDQHQTTFIKFGKILFIYTFFYIGAIITPYLINMISVFETTAATTSAHHLVIKSVSLPVSTFINLLVFVCNSVLLFLLFHNGQKIKKEFSPNSSLKFFNAGLLIWLIFYIATSVISLINAFNPTDQQLNDNMVITNSMLSIGIAIFQFITWFSLSSFFAKSGSLLPPAIKNNGNTASKILVLAAGLSIFSGFIKIFINSIINNANLEYFFIIMMLIFIISYIVSFILFVIGNLFLSSNLKKKVINWNSNGLPNRNGPGSVQRFCQYCGYNIEPSTKFCPDCGKSLKL